MVLQICNEYFEKSLMLIIKIKLLKKVHKIVENIFYYKERFLVVEFSRNFSGPTSPKTKSKMKLKQNKNPPMWLFIK